MPPPHFPGTQTSRGMHQDTAPLFEEQRNYPISGRMLLEKYDNVLSSLTIEDIKARHENAYNKESRE